MSNITTILKDYNAIKHNKNIPHDTKSIITSDLSKILKYSDGFATEFRCSDGRNLAASDTNHDFGRVEIDLLEEILPVCSITSGNQNLEISDENKELQSILTYVMGEIDDGTSTILLSGGRLPEITGSFWSHTPGNIKNDENAGFQGSEYTAFDLGNLGWKSRMSKIIQTFGDDTLDDDKSIIERVIREETGTDRVYIIDDIHSTSFVNDIKTKPKTISSSAEPFWCYLQTAQTIYDPAGKISPKTKPSIFSSPNVEFGWQDIRKAKTDGVISDTAARLETETLNFTALTSAQDIIDDNLSKLMLKNNAYLTISGDPLNYLSHKVNFMYKIPDPNNDDKYAIFDNRSSAIKNRNYISTIIKNALFKLNIKQKVPSKDGIKSHYIAKRIGDQGQANVCCEEEIPFIFKNRSGEFEARKTNGKHMFVSKDRLAVGAALLFNSPFVLHLKAGTPKSDLHHILYIRNDLREALMVKETPSMINDKITKINQQIRDTGGRMTDIPIDIRSYLDNFKKIVDNTELDIITYIKSIEMMIVRYIRCKILLDIAENADAPTPITPLADTATEDDIRAKKIEIQSTTRLLGKQIAITSVNKTNIEILDTVDTRDYKGELNRRASVPTTPAELRRMWRILYDKLQVHDTDELDFSGKFTLQCIAMSGLPNKDTRVNNYVSMITGKSPEVIFQRRGNAPSYKKGGWAATETLTIEKGDDQPYDFDDYFSGYSLKSESSPGKFIRNWLTTSKRPKFSGRGWFDITMSSRNKFTHQIEDSPLAMLIYIRNMLAIIYDIPELIYTELRHIPDLTIRLLNIYKTEDTEEGGDAPIVYFGSQGIEDYASRNIGGTLDIGTIENDFHTEIDNYHRSHDAQQDDTSQFISTVIDVMWTAMLTRESIEKFGNSQVVEGEGIIGLSEKNADNWLFGRPKDDEIDETDEDMDPLLKINEYAYERIYEKFKGKSLMDGAVNIKPRQSLRIIYGLDGTMKFSCGFYRNCLIPVMERVGDIFKMTEK